MCGDRSSPAISRLLLTPDVAQLVVDHLEVVRGDVQLDAADLPLVDREVAGDRQRALMVVEHEMCVDVHLVRLQVDLALQVRVDDAGRRDR